MPRSLSEKEVSLEEGVVKASNRVPTMRTDCVALMVAHEI